jgi:hypothetical protein
MISIPSARPRPDSRARLPIFRKSYSCGWRRLGVLVARVWRSTRFRISPSTSVGDFQPLSLRSRPAISFHPSVVAPAPNFQLADKDDGDLNVLCPSAESCDGNAASHHLPLSSSQCSESRPFSGLANATLRSKQADTHEASRHATTVTDLHRGAIGHLADGTFASCAAEHGPC